MAKALPLYTVLVAGVPLVLSHALELLRREFGSDLLAGVSIVAAVLLQEYLAGAFVVLMLSGGEALEAFALGGAPSVVPIVPVRQWVLSLPHRMRYVLAWDHALCRAVRASSRGRCSGGGGTARGKREYRADAAGPWRSFSASAPAHDPQRADEQSALCWRGRITGIPSTSRAPNTPSVVLIVSYRPLSGRIRPHREGSPCGPTLTRVRLRLNAPNPARPTNSNVNDAGSGTTAHRPGGAENAFLILGSHSSKKQDSSP
jgi:hypothetical protein